jgi:hypothetical protein
MAGDEGRLDASCGEDALRGNADRENRRLRVLRQHQLVFGTLENDLCETGERGFRLVEHRAGFRVRIGQRAAHAHLLGALTWKYERNQ